MENLEENKRDEFIENILNDLSSLNRNVSLDKSLTYLPNDKYEQLFEQFEILDSNIFNHKKVSQDSLQRLDRISFIMSKMADLDFSYEAEVGNMDNHLDHIVFSLNLMRDRLEEKLNKLEMYESAFKSFQDIYLLTDLKGTVICTNHTLHYLGIKNEHVIGMNIEKFILSKLIVFRYAVDLIFEGEDHNLSNNFIKNDDSKIILRITRKKTDSNGQNFMYKIELLNKNTYKEKNASILDVNVIRTINDLVYKTTEQTKDHKKVLVRLKSALQCLNHDPLNQQLINYIEAKLKTIS